MAIFDIPSDHCCDFVGFLVDEEEIVVAVVERVGQFDMHVVWGRAMLIFCMVLCQPVVPNGRFGTVFIGNCAHVGFVWMERVRRMGAVPEWGWAPWDGPGVAAAHGWCSRARLQGLHITSILITNDS